MNKCKHYHEEDEIIGWLDSDTPATAKAHRCYGTKMRESCLCGGDRTKCDFYSEVREEARMETEGVSGVPVERGYLSDWYIHSVDGAPPVWTEAHLDELFEDFYLIPR